MAADANTHRERRRFNLALPWLVLAVGVTLALVGVVAAAAPSERNDRARFERLSERVTSTIQMHLQTVAQTVRGAKANFASKPEVSQEEWRSYYTPFVLSVAGHREPRLRGPDTRAQLPVLEKRMQQEGVTGYRVAPGARANGRLWSPKSSRCPKTPGRSAAISPPTRSGAKRRNRRCAWGR